MATAKTKPTAKAKSKAPAKEKANPADTPTRTLRDAVYGLAVGDALGVPVEFMQRGTYRIDGMVGHGTHNQPAGTWSDDTSMTLATCDSIRRKGGIDIPDITRRFVAWMVDDDYAIDRHGFDIGSTVATALEEGRGCTHERSNGNGSLMRIIPLAFVKGATAEDVARVSAITHAHPTSIEGCQLYIGIARDLLAGATVEGAIAKLPRRGTYGRLRNIASLPLDEIRSSGYVVDTLEAALWALANTGSYAECVLACANMGRDTDTVAAVAGGLAGIVYGIDAIPAEWLETLRGKDIIEECLF